LFQAKILILTRTVKDHVALSHTERWSNLRDADHVHLEVAEHLIRRVVEEKKAALARGEIWCE
jgi:hypothetical protein